MTNTTDNEYNVLLAAYCKAAYPRLTQQEIGIRANLGNQAQVSRLLSDARAKGYLREVFEFPSEMSPDTRRDLEGKFERSFYEPHARLEAALVKRAEKLCDIRSEGGSPFKRLHVVATPGWSEGDDKARETAFAEFGASASEIVARYIDEAESCCVAWGRTVAVTVRRIRSRTNTPDPKKKFLPIAGEPTNYDPNGISPSDAARSLAAAWPESKDYSLRGVQARIPRAVYDRDQAEIARELAAYSNSYQEIFGQRGSRLIDEVAMILTGIGDISTSKRGGETSPDADPWYLETARAERAEGQDVLQLAVGNIGGVWIARDNLPEADSREVEQVNKRWLGAQLSDFRRCSLKADMGKRPGVVVLAVEPAKATIVLEALYLVNVLVVSRHLADALADELAIDRR